MNSTFGKEADFGYFCSKKWIQGEGIIQYKTSLIRG